MLSIIEKIRQGKLWNFPGGVHPPGRKALSQRMSVKTLSLPNYCYIPLKQHAGPAANLLVKEGDYVLKGQPLTVSTDNNSVPVHASTSGHVKTIAPHVSAHPSGLPEMTLVLEPDGLEQWRSQHPINDISALSPSQLAEHIKQSGISGMGGAGFPTHRKLSIKQDVEFLIINGVECEPYITSDDSVMQHYPDEIIAGIKILQHIVTPKHIIIAIEDNKPAAIKRMTKACHKHGEIDVVSIPTKYPAGGEKQLIQVLTGRQVPSKGLSMDVGVTMFNVGTCYAIADAVHRDIPLIQRIVTITGEGVNNPQNVWALLGSPVEHLLEHAQINQTRSDKIVMGGPMMGFAIQSARVPVVKITNCILVPAQGELNSGEDARECIRCSACADACPAQLLPQQLYWHAKAQEWEKTQDYYLFDCIECGACAYVCPSEIPLVQYYRNAKQEIRSEAQEKRQAEHAKIRFEARKERLEREHQARLEKQREASEKRKNAMKSNDNAAQDKVAAAMARVKAKQRPSAESASDTTQTNNNKTNVAAAVARARAKKMAQKEPSSTGQQIQDTSRETSVSDDKKSRVAEAIARAKAKKLAQQGEQGSTMQTAEPEQTAVTPSAEDDKKARIAAAVARAKAKKLAQQGEQSRNMQTAEPEQTSVTPQAEDDKKARIAAAVARAKAKKLAQQGEQSSDLQTAEPEQTTVTPPAEDDKKARIAAAVARAKAKKLAQQGEQVSDLQTAEPKQTAVIPPAEDDKKARIAAAVARAKAKKLAKKQDEESN